MIPDNLKKTELNAWHKEYGANMAEFAGYEMPLWYSAGIKHEHLAVLCGAGIFDTSHMAVVALEGKDAFSLLQHCFSRDLDACVGREKKGLAPGRCVYGVFLDRKGHVVDDAILYQLDASHYMICVNAGMGAVIAGHLEAEKKKWQATVTDLTDQVSKMDIQGPAAAKILRKVLQDPESLFDTFGYFSWKGHFDSSSPLAGAVRLNDGFPVLLSRSGYTGEFGFEIFLAPGRIEALWAEILLAGEDFTVLPCGLAARDSLRVGAVLPLSHQDIGPWPFINTPWAFALPYNEDGSGFTKKFIGDTAILNCSQDSYTYPFVGFDARKVAVGENSTVLDKNGKQIGTVLTCATDMGLDRIDGHIVSLTCPDLPEDFVPHGISCGFVKVTRTLDIGDAVTLQDERRQIKVEIVEDIRPNRTARRSLQEMLR